MNRTPSLINRNFILAFCAQLTLMAVYQFLIPTLPLYLKRLGSTEIEVGLLVGSMGMAAVVARPLVGRALVGVGAKVFMVVGACFYVVGSAAYFVMPPFWPLFLVRILHGAAFGSFHTASTTYVVNITDARHRTRVLAYFSLTMNFAGVIAPPLGVVLLNRFGSGHLFFVCTAVACCTLLVTTTLGRSSTTPSPGTVGGDRALLSKAAVPHSMVGFMALWVWASLATFFPIYATNQGMANPGLFFTAMAGTLILSRVLGGRILDILDKRTLVLLCLATSIVSMVILSVSRTQTMFLLSGVIWSAGHAFLVPSLMTLALERAGSAPSPVVATFYAVSDLGVFLGPLVMGFLVHYTSYPTMFFSLSFVGLVNFLYFWWFTRKA